MPFTNGFYECPRLPKVNGRPVSSLSSIVEYIYRQDPALCSAAWIDKYGKELEIPSCKHQFITVSLPTEKTDLKQLKKKISSLNYKYLDNAMMCVENHSGELQLKKKNLHIHILKRGMYTKNKIIRDMMSKFKLARNFINVKKGSTQSDYDNRVRYIHGDKSTELKKENCELDRKWRDKNGFQHIYIL